MERNLGTSLLSVLCLVCVHEIVLAQPQSEIALLRWRLEALHSQRLLTADIPLDKVGMCGSRHTGNYFDALPVKAQQIERHLLKTPQSPAAAANGYTVAGELSLASQCYGPITQLQLGVRHLHIEVHYLQTLGIRVCQRRQQFCANVTAATGDPKMCKDIFGFPDHGDSTGCHESSPTWLGFIIELHHWLDANPNELVIVRIHDDLLTQKIGCIHHYDIDDPIQTYLSTKVYTTAEQTHFRTITSSAPSTSGFPSTNYLLKNVSKQVVFIGSCAFGGRYIHDYKRAQQQTDDINEFPAKSFLPRPSCSSTIDQGLFDEFTFFYGDNFKANLTITKNGKPPVRVALPSGQDSAGTITLAKAQQIMDCGYTALMSNFGQHAAEGCVWTYRINNSGVSCPRNYCTVMTTNTLQRHRKYEWYNINCSSRQLPLACRVRDKKRLTNLWRLSDRKIRFPRVLHQDDAVWKDQFGVAHAYCPDGDGYSFDLPTSQRDADLLADYMIAKKVSEVWLWYSKGVTCHPTLRNPPPTFKIPSVTSFECPDVKKFDFIYNTKATESTIPAATTNRNKGNQTGKAANDGLTDGELAGIISASVVAGLLFLAILVMFILPYSLGRKEHLRQTYQPQQTRDTGRKPRGDQAIKPGEMTNFWVSKGDASGKAMANTAQSPTESVPSNSGDIFQRNQTAIPGITDTATRFNPLFGGEEETSSQVQLLSYSGINLDSPESVDRPLTAEQNSDHVCGDESGAGRESPHEGVAIDISAVDENEQEPSSPNETKPLVPEDPAEA